jgi:hypothetical protein
MKIINKCKFLEGWCFDTDLVSYSQYAIIEKRACSISLNILVIINNFKARFDVMKIDNNSLQTILSVSRDSLVIASLLYIIWFKLPPATTISSEKI